MSDRVSQPAGFTVELQPARVLFGAGRRLQLAPELASLGISRALLITSHPRLPWIDEVAQSLGLLCAGVHDKAVMHVPVEVAREGLAAARALAVDGLVAVGGGSSIGLAKAIARETGLPIAALPTTLAGSEMTNMYGLTDGRLKTTGVDLKVLPRLVVYDPELLATLPVAMTVSSAFNAMAHAVEAIYAPRRNPLMSALAEESIRALAESLPRTAQAPGDLASRQRSQYGAMLAGYCLSTAGVCLHHKLCHTLGGSFGMPHAETHTVILPHALAYNLPDAPEAATRVGGALGAPASDAAGALWDLQHTLGAPLKLAEIGFRRDDIERAAAIACERPYDNPRPVTPDGVRLLLEAAYEGRRPQPA